MAAADVVRALARFVQPARLARVRAQLAYRVVDTALVLESVMDAGNAAACLRSADAMGVQDVHIIAKYSGGALPATGSGAAAAASSRAADKGAHKWLSLHHHASTEECIVRLRADGFLIAASDVGGGAVDAAAAAAWTLAHAPPQPAPTSVEGAPPRSLGARRRVALVMGNESRGVSRLALREADVRFFLPQAGFVESLNLSVAAALALHAFLHRTPDYAPRALAAHATRLALKADRGSPMREPGEAAAPLDRGGSWTGSGGTGAGGTGGGGSSGDRDGSGGGDSPSEGAGAALRVEGISAGRVEELLARYLLREVPAAAAILDREGLRPPDF
jgi:tRNA (guanosine-2'-O-)-methyltransferase